MQNSQIPLKWYKPFAADDSAKVEIPVTTPDPTRASQSAGFPPLTMQPPESGGVPPQGEDFNGAMNQVARVAWWMLAGGALPFDAAWAANANIDGYPQGAVVTSADLQGDWISTADNNTNNPDTAGTAWVPGYTYGSAAMTVTVADVTLTPAQAAKPVVVVTGAMTAARQLIFPAWVRGWTIVNNTTGGFDLTVKTASGAGVALSPGATQMVLCDGTNFSTPRNPGALVGVQVLSATGTYVRTPGARSGLVQLVGGGAAGAGSSATGVGQVSIGAGGGGGAYGLHFYSGNLPATQAFVIGAGGAPSSGAGGGGGGTTSFGGLTAPGAGASPVPGLGTPPVLIGANTVATQATGCNIFNGVGSPGAFGFALGGGGFISGGGGDSPFGAGAYPNVTGSAAGPAAVSRGAGGAGASAGASSGAFAGGAGAPGLIVVYEYA